MLEKMLRATLPSIVKRKLGSLARSGGGGSDAERWRTNLVVFRRVARAPAGRPSRSVSQWWSSPTNRRHGGMEDGMASKKVVQEMLRRALEAKECELWPDCSCHHTLVHWQDNLRDEEKIWEPEILDQ